MANRKLSKEVSHSEKQIDAAAIAIFDVDEAINLEFIAMMDADGKPEIGDNMGRARDSWDNPRNRHCHAAYRRRARAALDAAEKAVAG